MEQNKEPKNIYTQIWSIDFILWCKSNSKEKGFILFSRNDAGIIKYPSSKKKNKRKEEERREEEKRGEERGKERGREGRRGKKGKRKRKEQLTGNEKRGDESRRTLN